MRTPFRLALALRQAGIAQTLHLEKKYQPIHCIRVPEDPGEPILSAAEHAALLAAPASPKRRALRRRAPVVWLTNGGDPLEHASISRVTRELQDSRRFVFLETDGQQLRRHLHEFRPDARLYLTVRLHGTAGAHDLRAKEAGAFARAIEGMRGAQLSGYLVCAHVAMDTETKLADIRVLLQDLRGLDADGIVVTAANLGGAEAATVREMVRSAKSFLGNSWWASVSTYVELALAAEPRKILFTDSIPAAREGAISADEVAAQ
jgi:hypothetical protein